MNFTELTDLENTNLISILEALGVPSEQIIEFKTTLDKQGKVFIPAIDTLINGEKRVFSLLSTKTCNDSFGFLNGVQGQFLDITNR